jgi:hypothetical protein
MSHTIATRYIGILRSRFKPHSLSIFRDCWSSCLIRSNSTTEVQLSLSFKSRNSLFQVCKTPSSWFCTFINEILLHSAGKESPHTFKHLSIVKLRCVINCWNKNSCYNDIGMHVCWHKLRQWSVQKALTPEYRASLAWLLNAGQCNATKFTRCFRLQCQVFAHFKNPSFFSCGNNVQDAVKA